MYKKLLVSNGGGIVSVAQQAEQLNAVTLAIGLGGTGIDALRALKREVYERVRPDNAPTPENPAKDDVFIPRYDHIKFLAVDTDRGSLGEAGDIDFIPDTDFCDISCSDITSLLNDTHNLRNNPNLQWLLTAQDNGLKIESADAGAGGVRQIGRLLLMQNCQKFVSMVKAAINAARAGMTGADINIHIFTGLAGGTGAGTFLDVCYILQHTLADMAIAGQAFTCGYFFLPDVNVQHHDTDYLYQNALAAMKELDYAMNYGTNNGRWKQQYYGFGVDTQEPPVKLAHLISGQDSNGNLPVDAYDYAMHVAADYVLEFIVKNAGFNLNAHISNFHTSVATVSKTAGATYNYCLLGAAATYMPYREILTYLAGKIFEGFAGMEGRLPGINDAEAFTESLSLTYQDLEFDIDTGKHMFGLPKMDPKLLQEQVMSTETGTTPPLLQPLYTARQFNVGEREKRIKALLDTEAVPGADANAAQHAMTAKVKQALIAIASDPEKGPYYAAALLKSVTGHDLDNIIAGMIRANTEKRDQALRDRGLARENWGKALAKFKSAGFGSRTRSSEEYVSVVAWWFKCDDDYNKYASMDDMLTKWRDQISDLSKNFFAVFADVIAELRNTFTENLTWLANNRVSDAAYAQPFMTVGELKTTLDASVAAMNVPLQVQRFIADLIRKPGVWENNDGDRIGAAVSDYFSAVLSDYAQRTMEDYLALKYNTPNKQTLTQKVFNNIIRPLADRSAPRFWTSQGTVIAAAKTIGYLSYPTISTTIQNAVLQYLATPGIGQITDRLSNITDRISIFMMLEGVPMFAYQAVATRLQEYKSSRIVGRHLYEGSDLDPRNDTFLPDIMPLSRIPAENYSAEQKTASADYDEALKVGIIVEESMAGARSKWYIRGVKADDIAAWKAELEKAVAVGTPAAIAAAVQAAQNKLAAGLPGTGKQQYIPNTGDTGYEASVLKDHVVDSLEHMQLLREQLAIVRPFTELLAAAEETASSAGKLGRDVKAFAEALGAGVIKIPNRFTYTYTGNVAGFATDMTLSDMDTLPYGKDIPPYSAFLGFCKLDAGERENIAQAVKSALIGDETALKASADTAKAALPDDKIGNWILLAHNNYQAEAEKVQQFFQLLKRELTTFIAGI